MTRYSSPITGAAALLWLGLCNAVAQQYPVQTITLVVPAAPGGGLDTTARQLAKAVEPKLGVNIVVENRSGASGTIGVAAVANAEPTGRTLGFVTNGMITVAPHSLTAVAYTEDSYVPILRVGITAYVMCVRPNFPANSGEEFLAHLMQNPDRYSYGNDGIGGTLHIAAEIAFRRFGIKASAVPFRGGNETLTAFLGGHLDVFGGGIPSILPYVKSGEAKCLLLTSSEGNGLVPQASGLAAVGIPDVDGGLWFGLIGPKGLPQSLVDQLARAFTEAAETPTVKEALARIGAEPGVLGPTDFKALIARDNATFATAVKELGLRH
jgi:tripartite-type tricarboxylate transporter receptor subunit TctC